ncbi:MAG: sulfatase-like hydrolase/transferase, partial [Deltaproteobacteria bacterium]|nr:sulfatase-like hydrolase/transferase [Deltaproteobacteria bacterium]
AGIFGYFGFFITVIYLLLFPFALTRYTKIIIPIAFWGLLVFFAIDLFSMNMFKFHINMLMIKMNIYNREGVGIPPKMLIGCGLIFATFLAALFVFQHKTTKPKENRKGGKLFIVVFSVIAALYGSSTIIHIWAYNNQVEQILTYDYYPPLYYPATKRTRLRTPHDPALDGPEEVRITDFGGLKQNEGGKILKYPLAYPEFAHNEDSKKPILVIMLESWQADCFNAEVMPFLYGFSKEATVFERHFTSGNTTFPGLFGFFYGLHAGNFDIIRNNPDSYLNVFTNSLFTNGYKIRVYTRSPLKTFHFKTILFREADLEDVHNLGEDRDIVDFFLEDLWDEKQNGLYFDYMFLTSSHYPYKYPEEHAVYDGIPEYQLYDLVADRNKEWKKYKNAYLNSLHYEDALIEEIFDNLKKKGVFDDYWIIFTGDHSEEFGEDGKGHWGHGSNFSRPQTLVPFIVKRPGQKTGEVVKVTTMHEDFVPTILEEVLKTTTPPEMYSDGHNLYQINEERGVVVYSYVDAAYIFDNTVIEKKRGKKYDWMTKEELPGSLNEREIKAIRELFEEEQRFMRDGS